ncbi:unnamed protein product, partial [Chrysoparadoxa australica]
QLKIALIKLLEVATKARNGKTSAPSVLLLEHGLVTPAVLSSLAESMVLRDPSLEVRHQAASLLNNLWLASDAATRVQLVRSLTAEMPVVVGYGLQAKDWLLFLVNAVAVIAETGPDEPLRMLIEVLGTTLREQSQALQNHPNRRLYSVVNTLVPAHSQQQNFEEQPCLCCRRPAKGATATAAPAHSASGPASAAGSGPLALPSSQLPSSASREGQAYQSQQLDSIKQATRTTEDAVMVQLKGQYGIKRIGLRIADAHGRFVKTLNVYYHAKPVVSLNELKLPENVAKWRLAVSVPVELPLPLVTANLMFEYAEFHDKEDQGHGRSSLHCPRCGRPVTDLHGVCRQCGEVAFQCRQCRHINYENLDAFLCVDCGYCAYAQFSYRFLTYKPVIASGVVCEADRLEALRTVDACSERIRSARAEAEQLRPYVLELVQRLDIAVSHGSAPVDDMPELPTQAP